MGHPRVVSNHRKTKRRRRTDRPPVYGSLQVSDQLKGGVGVGSTELLSGLFSQKQDSHNPEQELVNHQTRFIGISSWTPSGCIEDTQWTILPVRPQTLKEKESNSLKPTTVLCPKTVVASPTFAELLQTETGNSNTKGHSGVGIRIVEVEPLCLDALFVTVDGDALERHAEVQKKFGGGFHGNRTNSLSGKGKEKVNGISNGQVNRLHEDHVLRLRDDQLTSAVREAIKISMVVRRGDLLPLPLPAHPITHVPLPPAKITLCEPLNQGLLSDSTKIVVQRVYHHEAASRITPRTPLHQAFRNQTTIDGYDTSNEHFYSAAEDVPNSRPSKSGGSEEMSSSDESEKDFGSSSDDSAGEMISMKAPPLPMQPSGRSSSRTATTPRIDGFRANGTATPGSVISNATAMTARQGSRERIRIFKAKSLVGRIPDDSLHPEPAADEDDEARVFVDIKCLVKLGCFSGDWVKVEAAAASIDTTTGILGIGAYGHPELAETFRPARIYGLPDLQPSVTPRYTRGNMSMRRSSVTPAPTIAGFDLSAWLPPILIANLGHPARVRMSPLQDSKSGSATLGRVSNRPKLRTTASPPVARELTLLRVSTPLSTERAMQTGLFTALKHYFEQKRRILRQGDFVSLLVDAKVSRILAQPVHSTELEFDMDELLSNPSSEHSGPSPELDVAWFKVGHIVCETSEDCNLPIGIWGGAASIEPKVTRMRQAGSEQCKVPSTLDSPWELYLGLKSSTNSPPIRSAVESCIKAVPKPCVTPLQRRLRELMAAATSSRAIHLGMRPIAILLHSTQRNIGKGTVASHAASDLGLHVFDVDAYDILSEGAAGGDVKTEAFLKARVDRALSCGAAYTTVVIRHVEALHADRMIGALKDVVSDGRVLVATTTEIEKIPNGMRSLFTHEIDFSAPDQGEREVILKDVIQSRSIDLARDVDLTAIAIKTAALVAGNLADIVDRATVSRQERLEQLCARTSKATEVGEILRRDIIISGGEYARCILKEDFDIAVEAARKNFADAIGAPKIPNVSWDDVGGLEYVKDAVMETIQLPLERPELFAKGMKKRSGILFYGPPGTGKTLLAKAIATEFSLNFFSVKGPELLNMYIGESEANVRRVFQRARDARPCVVFFDELDSVAPKRGNQGDSGGVMDRIVSQLLAELDGMSDGEEGGGGVFVIGATNRPDLLDQALLRPGRFDKMLYLGVSDTHKKQLTILEALTRKFTLHPKMSLGRVAESLPFTYTGADLYALCSDAMLKAITRQASAVDVKIKALVGGPVTTAYFFDHLAKHEDIAVMVTEGDFSAAQRELVGSVSAKELEHYQRVRQTFEGSPKIMAAVAPNTTGISKIPAPVNDARVYHQSAPAKRPKPPHREDTLRPPATNGKSKGKGKATQWDSDDDDDDEAYVTSNDFGSPKRRCSNGFCDPGQDDEEELYSS